MGRNKEEVRRKSATFRLHHLWLDKIKERAKESGMSQADCIEWAMNISRKEWEENYCKKDAKSDKDKKKNAEIIDAWKLGKKELVKYAERTTEQRYMHDILYGRHGKLDLENFMQLDPQNILDRLKGKFHRRSTGWQEYHG